MLRGGFGGPRPTLWSTWLIGESAQAVIPAKAGIHFDLQASSAQSKTKMDPGLRRDDGSVIGWALAHRPKNSGDIAQITRSGDCFAGPRRR
jgi:hypothetical protein